LSNFNFLPDQLKKFGLNGPVQQIVFEKIELSNGFSESTHRGSGFDGGNRDVELGPFDLKHVHDALRTEQGG
jgi:hypothetical protein